MGLWACQKKFRLVHNQEHYPLIFVSAQAESPSIAKKTIKEIVKSYNIIKSSE